MNNYQGAGANIIEVNSATQYLGNNASPQPISDVFAIPTQLINRVGSRFRITLSGQINNGTTPGNVVLTAGGFSGGGALLAALTIPATATPTASTAYCHESSWEWVCLNPVTGLGYMQIKSHVSQMNSWTDAVPLFLNIGQVIESFFLANHGGNQDAQYFFLTAAIAQAASGTTTFTNYVKFDFTPGPQ